ncbi:helix-turn-helix transcriptional regulator [Myxococcus vastator]|uniref:helix-turn-helix transcriptional regulator n=1 Tax=Myxococcus vastator TaxID=2709664 RepID=UPI001F07A1C5|nr:LuxR C-terminal-related transcriptional regulator [Myxococcus vastator]
MVASIRLNSREFLLTHDVALALHESKHLPDMLSQAQAPLARLIPADYWAMCIVTPGRPVEYQWIEEAGAPNELLAQYESLKANDFVLQSVVRQPDTVLRDEEMLSRRALEHSLLYQQSREIGVNLEQVMAVLLNIDAGVFCGITAYRDKCRPFSRKEQGAMQLLSRHFKAAIRNSRILDSALTGYRLLEALGQRQGFEFIILNAAASEVHRSRRASEILDAWFAHAPRTRAGLPRSFVDRLKALVRMDLLERDGSDTVEFHQNDQSLHVTFIELPPHEGPRQWGLFLNEFPKSISLPIQLARQLTERQAAVAEAMANNMNTDQIAEALRMKPNTAKVHVRDIYGRLRCDSRADFMHQIAQLLKPV